MLTSVLMTPLRPGRRSITGLLAGLGLVLVLLATPASAPARSIYQSKLLWATVNVCDTAAHPDTVGIRASMPGSGRSGESMWMRFQLQYWKASDESWHNIGASGDSGFIGVGSARYRARETGRNFTVKPPRTGAFLLRGAVTFEWRDEDGDVVRRARKRTRTLDQRVVGADPVGFSAAKCEIRK